MRYQADISRNYALLLCAVAKEGEGEWHPVDCSAGEAVKDGARIQWKYDSDASCWKWNASMHPFWIDRAGINRRLSQESEVTVG